MTTVMNVNSNKGSPPQLGGLGAAMAAPPQLGGLGAARAALRHPGMATLGGGECL